MRGGGERPTLGLCPSLPFFLNKFLDDEVACKIDDEREEDLDFFKSDCGVLNALCSSLLVLGVGRVDPRGMMRGREREEAKRVKERNGCG